MDYRLEHFRFELREDPTSRIFFKLGEHLRREGELDEAIEILEAGLRQHTNYVAAWVSLGRAQLANGDARGAQTSLERSLELDPENPLASRVLGEAAIANDEWVTAVKALKRARGLSPQDDELDERIEFVEARLADLGPLEKPPPKVVSVDVKGSGSEGEPFAIHSTGDTGIWDDADDVFAAGDVEGDSETVEDASEEEAEELAEEAQGSAASSDEFAEPEPLTEDELSSIMDEESVDEGAETAVEAGDQEGPELEDSEMFEEEDFAAPDFEQEPEFESEPEEEPETEGEPGPAFEQEAEPEVDAEPEFEQAFEAEAEIEPESDSEPEPEDEPEEELETVSDPDPTPLPEPLPDSWPDRDSGSDLEKDADGVPLPTMTLARLAIDQGDLDLAERTLRGVLEREPDHPEAIELLETMIAGPPEGVQEGTGRDLLDAKAEALQRWLDAVRLASERLRT